MLIALSQASVEGAEPVLRRRADLFAADFEDRARAHLAPKCALAAARSVQRHGGVVEDRLNTRLVIYMVAIKHARKLMRCGQAAVVAYTSDAVQAGAHAPQQLPSASAGCGEPPVVVAPVIFCVDLTSGCDEI